MKLTITIDLDNAAFAVEDDDGDETQERNGREVADILRELADRAYEDDPLDPRWALPLHDSNGNAIGKAAIQA